MRDRGFAPRTETAGGVLGPLAETEARAQQKVHSREDKTMGLILKVSAGGPPVGAYSGKFTGVEETENEQYGAGLKWKWEIVGGPQAGQTATRITSPNPTLKNACGKILTGLVGRPLLADEVFDPATFVGKQYLVVVAATESGSTRVETVTQAPAA